MKIAKKDALLWFRFFAELPEDEEILVHQQEIVLDTLTQIELAVNKRREKMMAEIPGLKTLAGRTYYVGEDERFPQGWLKLFLFIHADSLRPHGLRQFYKIHRVV